MGYYYYPKLIVGGLFSCKSLARASKHKVLLVDGDDQQSTTAWFSQRQVTHPDLSPNLAFAQIAGKAVRERVLKVSSQYDAIVIDVGGRDTTTQRAALSVADLFLTHIPQVNQERR